MVSQHWLVHVLGPREECHLLVRPYISSSVLHILFVLLWWFVRWKASSRTAAAFSKQPMEFLCSSHLAFSPCFSLAPMRCIHRAVLIQPQLEKKSRFILSDRSDFRNINNLSIVVHTFARCILTSLSVDEILLPRYVNLTTKFRRLPLLVEVPPSRLKYIYSVLFFIHMECNTFCCSRLCSRDSAWAGVFARSVRASASESVSAGYRLILAFFLVSSYFLLLDLSTFDVRNLGRLWISMVQMYLFCKTPATKSKKSGAPSG